MQDVNADRSRRSTSCKPLNTYCRAVGQSRRTFVGRQSLSLSCGHFSGSNHRRGAFGSYFARFDAAACSTATTATPIREGMVVLGLDIIQSFALRGGLNETRPLSDRVGAVL
jgi:hypothetical protein